MELLLSNTEWMIFNILLAFLGVIFGLLFYNLKSQPFKIFSLFLWLIFLPNTIYLITDIQYFPRQFMRSEFAIQIWLLAQYLLVFSLGIITFLVSMHLLEKSLLKTKLKKDRVTTTFILVAVNYIIAFAVFLGKQERVSSWFVFTDPKGILAGSTHLISSTENLLKIILFGSLCTLIYFSFKRLTQK